MNYLLLFIIIILIFSTIIYIIYCYNPTKSFGVYNSFNNVLEKLLGKKYGGFFKALINYIFFENNSLVQIFYFCLILFGNYGVYYFFKKYQFLLSFKEISIEFIIFVFALYCYYKTAKIDPGYWTAKNRKYFSEKYKDRYDNALNSKNNFCKTCELDRPPYTKHCNLCKHCIVNHDHHCIWIKGCVGERNYKWFISFLFTHSVFCGIKSAYLIKILIYVIKKNNLFNIKYQDTHTGEIFNASYKIIFKYLFASYNILIFLIILTFTMSIALLFFFFYHCYLIKLNESSSYTGRKSYYNYYYQEKLIDVANEIDKLEEKENVKEEELKKKKRELLDIGNKINTLSTNKSVGFFKYFIEVFKR